jgi:hypothetical protein
MAEQHTGADCRALLCDGCKGVPIAWHRRCGIMPRVSDAMQATYDGVTSDDASSIILDDDSLFALLDVLAAVADRLDNQDEIRKRQSKARVRSAYDKTTAPHSGTIKEAS